MVLYQLNILHCIDGAVVGPHVEAVPLVDFVLVLFGDLLHHLTRNKLKLTKFKSGLPKISRF